MGWWPRRRKQNRRVRPAAPVAAGRRRLNPRLVGALVSVVLLLGPLAWAYSALHDPARFPIRTVNVASGSFHHVSARQVEAAVRPFLAAGFFNIDVRAVQAAVDALPWVDRCSVRRSWPDRLYVRVVEQQPLARWNADALLNRRGEAFHPAPDELPKGLPRLTGPDGLEKVVAGMYREVSQGLAPFHLQVAALTLDARRSWSLALADGSRFEMGRSEPYRRLMAFLKVYPRLVASRHGEALQRVDLRYTNGFAVSWKSPSGPQTHSGG